MFFKSPPYLPTVDPGNSPLALHRLGDIRKQFQVGVPWCSYRHRIKRSQALLPKPLNSPGQPRAMRHRRHCHDKHREKESSYSGAHRLSKAPSDEERHRWVWVRRVTGEHFLLPFNGWAQRGGLSYISFQNLTIVWLNRRWKDYKATQRLWI